MCLDDLWYITEVVEVKFEYEAEQPDELTIHVGDIIKNCMIVEKGWMEGELNGKRGIFLSNYLVEIISPPPTPGVHVCLVCLYMCGHLCTCNSYHS